jgi:ATP-dependent DNA ligase
VAAHPQRARLGPDRYSLIAEAAGALQARSFLLDGEVVACDGDGVPT